MVELELVSVAPAIGVDAVGCTADRGQSNSCARDPSRATGAPSYPLFPIESTTYHPWTVLHALWHTIFMAINFERIRDCLAPVWSAKLSSVDGYAGRDLCEDWGANWPQLLAKAPWVLSMGWWVSILSGGAPSSAATCFALVALPPMLLPYAYVRGFQIIHITMWFAIFKRRSPRRLMFFISLIWITSIIVLVGVFLDTVSMVEHQEYLGSVASAIPAMMLVVYEQINCHLSRFTYKVFGKGVPLMWCSIANAITIATTETLRLIFLLSTIRPGVASFRESGMSLYQALQAVIITSISQILNRMHVVPALWLAWRKRVLFCLDEEMDVQLRSRLAHGYSSMWVGLILLVYHTLERGQELGKTYYWEIWIIFMLHVFSMAFTDLAVVLIQQHLYKSHCGKALGLRQTFGRLLEPGQHLIPHFREALQPAEPWLTEHVKHGVSEPCGFWICRPETAGAVLVSGCVCSIAWHGMLGYYGW